MGKQTRSKKSESAIGKGKAPNKLLTLGDMLEEYICLKEQKVILSQEKIRLEQEKFRVQTLLRGMQDAMNAYNGGGPSASAAAPLPSSVVMPTLPAGTIMASPAGKIFLIILHPIRS
ncbi:hypothetical protein L2E82_21060 [Cichorium intybus]|uniref:Uncharacterized protein n=1 Tax=Cichorium intybus TaxID=13427 RepID=A0ACB9DVD8_CICIN|nr:hypothetical protein L2E82_21060 [Cichorium intybus]